MVEYAYDAWGKLLSTITNPNNDDAADLGLYNPLRYRAYVYDNETALYYLQSRYYDPELGRFINADAFASTGQGILGNNMFAYCLNNPVIHADAGGNLPSGIINSNAMTHNGGSVRPISDNERRAKQAKKLFNSSEEAVLYADDFAFYKGALVIRHSSDFLTSWSLLGIIFLNRNVNSEGTLKHEYGHFLQEQAYGPQKYITAVFAPSATYNLLSRRFSSLNSNYYNMPWEYNADIRGGVNRGYASWSKIISTVYFGMQRVLP